MKTVYKFCPNTGEYLGTRKAPLCPECQNHYLMPRCTTDVCPPESKPRFVPVWNGENWYYEHDWRGEYVLLPDLTTVIKIKVIGICAPDHGQVLTEKEVKQYKAGIKPIIERESEKKFNVTTKNGMKILIIIQN